MSEDSNVSQLGDLIKKNKQSVVVGFVITIVLTVALFGINFWYAPLSQGELNPIIFATRTIGFLLIWLIVTFLIARLSILKVLGVLSLLFIVVITTEYLRLPVNNPITIPALILFWLGISYLLLPGFMKKHRYIISSVHVAVLVYFYSFRTSSNFQEIHLQIIVYYITISVSFTFIFWIYQQINWLITIRLNQTKTELALLKSQVNPHFFFNTLNNLYGLVMEKSDEAPMVMLKLSDMMRYTIDMGNQDEVSIMDEIEYLKNYISLHEIRYHKNVDIQFVHEVDKNVKVAPLLFINLLENAFKHGVESSVGNAYVHISLKTRRNKLAFEINNTFDNATIQKENGTGLDNLKKRLNHSYPYRHTLNIEQKRGVYGVYLGLSLNPFQIV
ncbi:sensor histidine kinase [Flagellimonas meridianipacifica]|uniref:GHKL domain-containing protein n=1 Tax=Flagellimonas meridianipacifica TaxID=1080225 RepID=A0A2T0MAD4_9FLAO|nr:sensor histidine kinase [Allomuricauda pacifica]PRX54443.1 GHKL domain-containing protein [Allomuricauda pacifica]